MTQTKKTNSIKSGLDDKKFGFCFQFEVNEVVDKVTMNFGYYDGGFRESYPRYVLVNEKLAKGCYLKEINNPGLYSLISMTTIEELDVRFLVKLIDEHVEHDKN